MYHIIFDLEMTVWATKPKKINNKYVIYDKNKKIILDRKPIQEVIEIGAVKLDGDLNVVDTFQSFVNPIYCPITNKCTKITGILPEDVKYKSPFRKVIHNFAEWINSTGPQYSLYSWSDSDKLQILKECEDKSLNAMILDCFKNYIDLQKEFSFLSGEEIHQQVSLKNAAQMLNIDFTQEHRALSDADVTSKILIEMINNWKNRLNKN